MTMHSSLPDPWWKIERNLLQEARHQRTARLAHKPHYHHLLTGIDWRPYRQMLKRPLAELRTHLKTWVQGAIHFKEAGQTKLCPLCQVPAAPKHIIWLCKWHQGQQQKPMPPEWADRIFAHDEEPLWNCGWVPFEPQEHHQYPHPYQGHGKWQDLQILSPSQPQGWAFTLDATPSTYDARSQVWVFGLCVHHLTMGQLQRLAAITGIRKNQSSPGRIGCTCKAHQHPSPGYCATHDSLGSLVWTNPNQRAPYQDILEHVTDQDYQRVTVLYVCRSARTPEAPGNEPQLRRRQRDAALAARERANNLHDKKLTEWQQVLDEDHMTIYRHAARSPQGTSASTPNNTKCSWWANAPNHGNHHSIDGHHTGAAINVGLVGYVFTKR